MWIYRKGTKPVLIGGTSPVGYVDIYFVGYLQDVWDRQEVVQKFIEVEEYDFADKARAAVNYLNGGNSEVEVSGIVYNTH